MDVSSPGDGKINNLWIATGGGLGVAGCLIGLAAFLGGCAGFSASFDLGVLPVLFSIAGSISTVVGAWPRRSTALAEPRAVPALFVNACSLIGGILLLSIAWHWRICSTG